MDRKHSVENNIFRGTLIIIIVGVLAKFASFISEAILAAYLGTTYLSDAYYMVTSIQQVIYPMLSVGIWKVFLPIYKEKLAKGQKDVANNLANKFTTFTTFVSIIAVILLMIFGDVVVGIVAPGFTGETKALCIQLVKISAPMYVFIIAAAIYSVMLQCHNNFFGSQIREVVSHVPTIVAALFFYKIYGVYALAIALVVGGLFRFLIELPFVDWGYRYKPDFRFRDRELKTMFKRLPSALVSEGVNQINILVDKVMASVLLEGAVSSLNYANKLTTVFSGLLSTAIATALYPQMIELIALDKKQELSSLMTKIMNLFSLLMIPVTFFCFLFASSLVSAVFERGAFNADSVAITSGVFAFYSVGLFFIACNTVLTNVFYGYGDIKTPMYISIVGLICNVIGNLAFVYLWGVKGLALSTSISAVITYIVRLVYVKKYVLLNGKRIVYTAIRVVLASVIACGIPAIVFSIAQINVYIELVIAAIIWVVLYFILIKMFKVNEIDDLIDMFTRRLKRL